MATTLNISMPEPMRRYIEAQAAAGNYSASEYVRHLVRADEQLKTEKRRKLMSELLAISEAQIARGDISHITLDELMERGRKRRLKKKK